MELEKNNKFIVNNLKHNLGNYIVPENCINGIAVDVGANNGCFINDYKDFFSKIYAYEANFYLVKKLNEVYKNFKNIEIFNNAVSDSDDKILKLLAHKYTDDNGSYCIKKNIQHQDWDEFVCEVNSISLETILKKHGNIDYMKIDCETSEYEFLLNKNLSSIKYIALELHNQLGIEKYVELYNWICRTHSPNQKLNYIFGQHQEILFKLN